MASQRRSLWSLLVRSFAGLAFAVVWSQAPAQPTSRVALVIGNEAYANAPLSNPANDAAAVGKALQELGFSVILVRDATKLQMEDAITRMREQMSGRSGVGMLYYAGHALQLDWRNYLVPVDAKLGTRGDVPSQTIDLQSVLDAFKSAGNRMNIVVLDACRNNPFGATGRGHGLAQMDAPAGTFLAYATAPGNVAEDGISGGNSLYTQYFVQELKQPRSRIEDVFKRVRLQVRQRTEGRQIPWESTSLEDEFHFDRGLLAATPVEGSLKEQAFNREKADWDRISTTKNVEQLYGFLKAYPNGNMSDLAVAMIDQLQAPRVAPPPDRDGVAHSDWASRFRAGDRYEFSIKDGWTGLPRGSGSVFINLLSANRVRAEGNGMPGMVVEHGALQVRGSGGAYDPPVPLIPGGAFQAGNKSSTRSIWTGPDGAQSWVDFDTRIVGRESVSVAGVTVEAWKVEAKFTRQDGLLGRHTYWYDPAWGYPIKWATEFRGTGPRDTKLNTRQESVIRELTSRSRGK